MTLKAQVTKVKIEKGNIKLKSFCTAKETIDKAKMQLVEWENTTYLIKRLMSQTYEDLTKLERKQTLKMIKGIDIS